MIKLLIEYIFSTYYKYYIYDKQHIIYYQYKRTKFLSLMPPTLTVGLCRACSRGPATSR